MPDTMARKTVPVTAEEADLIERARTAGTVYHDALVELAGTDVSRSEAATLHVLLGAGLAALGELVALHDYARLAASRDAEDVAYASAMRGRARGRQ